MTSSVQPPAASTRPSTPAADSIARVAVVPTATTRPPRDRAALTSAAVSAVTSNRSGCGASPASWDETPVWRRIGATRTPDRTSRVTSRLVNGRPALGISALPGSREKTVW